MATTIPPDIEQYVDEAIRAGRYQSGEQVFKEAFRLLRNHDRQVETLHADVKAGFDELDRGEGIEVDDSGLREFFDDVQARGQHRYSSAKNRP
jgi:antitoxin ParD1/3/4